MIFVQPPITLYTTQCCEIDLFQSDFEGDRMSVPDKQQSEYDKDYINDNFVNEKTGFKNKPSREQNYLKLRRRK